MFYFDIIIIPVTRRVKGTLDSSENVFLGQPIRIDETNTF